MPGDTDSDARIALVERLTAAHEQRLNDHDRQLLSHAESINSWGKESGQFYITATRVEYIAKAVDELKEQFASEKAERQQTKQWFATYEASRDDASETKSDHSMAHRLAIWASVIGTCGWLTALILGLLTLISHWAH